MTDTLSRGSIFSNTFWVPVHGAVIDRVSGARPALGLSLQLLARDVLTGPVWYTCLRQRRPCRQNVIAAGGKSTDVTAARNDHRFTTDRATPGPYSANTREFGFHLHYLLQHHFTVHHSSLLVQTQNLHFHSSLNPSLHHCLPYLSPERRQ